MTATTRLILALGASAVALGAAAQQPAAPADTTKPAPPPVAAPADTGRKAPVITSAMLPDSMAGHTAVTYVSGETIYIGAGTLDGLWSASRVAVLRNGILVAELTVKFLSSHSAACVRTAGTATVTVNMYDSVRFSKMPADSVKLAQHFAGGASGRMPQRSALRSLGIFGRVGVSYFLTNMKDSVGGSISQPGLDINLVGTNVGGSQISFAIDTRSRQTYSTLPGGTTSNDQLVHVYQANMTWADPKSGAQITAGRQYVAALSSITMFDGITAQFVRTHWTFGAIGGSQPDPITLGFSNSIMQYGAFVQAHNSNVIVPGQPLGPRWSITTGAIGSYDHGAINREFAFVQAFYADQRFTLYATQEIDYNRGWKSYVGLPTFSPTSTFATANLAASRWLSFYAGYDNRHNVLLYRDYTSPETSFDDAFREGMWGGLSFSAIPVVRFGGDARLSNGGPAGTANSYTGWLYADRGLPLQMAFRVRATKYTSMHSDGWLYAGSFGLNPTWRFRLEANGGWRNEVDPTVVPMPLQTYVKWIGANMDIGLSRSWYFIFTGMRTRGGLESNDQLYGSLSYRF